MGKCETNNKQVALADIKAEVNKHQLKARIVMNHANLLFHPFFKKKKKSSTNVSVKQ